MSILLINNDSDSWQELQDVTRACGYDVITIHHRNMASVDIKKFDVAILSGGWWYDDEQELLREYAQELALIRDSPIPILGICIGMQLMHVALDQAVPLIDEPQSGFKQITITAAGQKLFDLPVHITVFKNHTRAVLEADPNFEVLAYSPGHVEIIHHLTRPLLGVQFHPESAASPKEAQLLLHKLIASLLKTTDKS